ncbi:MAG: Calx-beta domain-containing protein, partial [Flavobacteriales bacterium]
MTLRPLIFPVASILLFTACGGGEEPTPAEFRFSNDRTAFENEANSVFSFDVRIDEAKTEEVRVQYATVDGSATAGEDYIATSGTLTFAPGETKKSIEVEIIVDEWLEPDENFIVALSAPEGGYLRDNIQEAVGTIRNDDTSIQISDAGYSTPDTYPGMTLVWGDEFDTPGVPDPSKWTYDLGNGQWGWGNNELQNYTNSPENVTVQDGRCYIFARNEGGFTSARL